MSELKLTIINACKEQLTGNIHSLQAILHEVRNSANSESKSSAGDKHETSRAMMQLEQEKLGKQLQEAEDRLNEFNKIDFNKTFQTIKQGCLVETDKGLFFIAVSLGKITAGTNAVFVISDKSPLALAIAGFKQKDTVPFNGVLYQIITVA